MAAWRHIITALGVGASLCAALPVQAVHAAGPVLRVSGIPGVGTLRVQRLHDREPDPNGSILAVELADGGRLALRLHKFRHGGAVARAVDRRPESRVDSADGGTLAMTLAAGYRRAALDFNIAADSSGTATPNVLSELTWNDLSVLAVDARLRRLIGNHLDLRGDFAYGILFDGGNRDSDYLGDNRTLEFSRSRNSADEGSLFKASAAVGYGIDLGQVSGDGPWARLTPLLGYAVHQQNLVITDGYQEISNLPGFTPPIGPFAGLDSRYESAWKGPWAGLDLEFAGLRGLRLNASLEYHWARYEGIGNWNLREDFAHPVSFRHTADGHGLVAGLDLSMESSGGLSWSLALDFERWRTDPGDDTTFFADDSSAHTRLNRVNWKSWGLGLRMRHDF